MRGARHVIVTFGVSQQPELAALPREEYHRFGGHFLALAVRIPGQYMLAGACWPS